MNATIERHSTILRSFEVYQNLPVLYSDSSTLKIFSMFLTDNPEISEIIQTPIPKKPELASTKDKNTQQYKELLEIYESENRTLFLQKKEAYLKLVNYLLEVVRKGEEIEDSENPIKVLLFPNFPVNGEIFTLAFCTSHNPTTIANASFNFGHLSNDIIEAFKDFKRTNGLLIEYDIARNRIGEIGMNLFQLDQKIKKYKIKSNSLALTTKPKVSSNFDGISNTVSELARKFVKFRIVHIAGDKYLTEADLFQEHSAFEAEES